MVNTASGTKISMESWLASYDNNLNNYWIHRNFALFQWKKKCIQEQLTCNELSIKCIDF